MEFKIPQKIDVEDKLVGPLTLKQFLKLLVGAGLVYLLYTYLRTIGLPFFLVLFILAPVITFFGLLAFYKVNEQPFEKFLFSLASYYLKPSKRIWKRAPQKEKMEIKTPQVEKEPLPKKTISRGHLEELAYILDTRGNIEENKTSSLIDQMKEALINKRTGEEEISRRETPKGIEELLPPKVKMPPELLSHKDGKTNTEEQNPPDQSGREENNEQSK